jgi:hypothetical protein
MDIKKAFKSHWLVVMIFLSGVALAASKGPWYPWVNMGGILLIGVSGILSVKGATTT